MPLPRGFVRILATAGYRLRRLAFRLLRIERAGVHAVALTPEGKVVLVRLTYAPGWRLPGGGRGKDEAPEAAVLRELREEIGLTAHGPVSWIGEDRDELGDIFLVPEVACRPCRSFEIEAVGAFPLDRLPRDISALARRQIAAAVIALDGSAS